MTPAPRYAPFIYVFVPFAVLLAGANLYAETSPNLTFGRVVGTILLTAAFALPAVVLFFLRDPSTASPHYFRYWQLTWVFGFLGYALHFYFSAGVWFGWDFAQILRRQGLLTLTTNCLLLVVWALDAALGLLGPGVGGRAGLVLRWLAHVLFVIAFVTASIVFRSEFRTTLSLVLGVVLIVTSVGALVLRWWK